MFEARIDRKVFVGADGVGRQVLRDVGFSIASGEVIALLGASGIGKSTTFTSGPANSILSILPCYPPFGTRGSARTFCNRY